MVHRWGAFNLIMPQPDSIHVLFDLRWMKLGRAGGIEQATHELINALAGLDRRNRYTLYCPRGTYYELDLPDGFTPTVRFSDRAEVARRHLRSPVENGLPAADLVHSFTGYSESDLIDRQGVLTVSDLLHLHHPEFFTEQDLAIRARRDRESFPQAKHIICVSEFTRQDVHRRLGVPLEKLTTIGNIPAGYARTKLDPVRQGRILSGLGLSGPFVFFPAHPWPHKNHHRLLQAWETVRSSLPAGWKLVLTGRAFPDDHPAAALLHRQHDAGITLHLGYRSPLEMQALLHGCEGLVFPSLFEGFGMPVAEAIVAGKPVACSRSTSLPEIAGEAAEYFDPLSVDDMARALRGLLTDEVLRQRLLTEGKARQARFEPQAVAAATLGVYLRVAGHTADEADAEVAELKEEADRRSAPVPSLRLARARHHARAAEVALRRFKIMAAASHISVTCVFSPAMAWNRFLLALVCHGEVVIRRILSNKAVSSVPAP